MRRHRVVSLLCCTLAGGAGRRAGGPTRRWKRTYRRHRQRLLAQAEADDALARLGVWRALLAAEQIRRDLTPFLEKIRQP